MYFVNDETFLFWIPCIGNDFGMNTSDFVSLVSELCLVDMLCFSLFVLKLMTLASKKDFPWTIFQYSVSLSPAEYEYENHFFPSRPDFPKLYDNGVKIN